jgi:hypothetical protein
LKRSLWLAFLISPLAAPLIYLVMVMFFVPDTTPKQERTVESALISFVLFLAPASYLVSFVFGAPLLYILGRFKILSFWWVTGLSAPLGSLAVTCLLIISIAFGASVQWSHVGLQETFLFLATGAFLGVVIAVVFCLITGISCRSNGTPSWRGTP